MSKAKGISLDNLASEVKNTLKIYSEEITAKIKEAALEVAKECAENLKKSSPRGKSKRKVYSKGWLAKVEFENALELRASIHNKNAPGLTHLLEYGHAGPKPAPAHPHIRPAEQKAIKKFEKLVEKAVKG